MGRLNHGRIKALKTPGLHGDGDTLYLRVGSGGSKSWIQRVAINGQRRDIGLGGWPVVSLARARERAFANRVAISYGRDPLAEKRRASVPTFREAAVKTFEANRPRWRNVKTAKNWAQQLERHAFDVVGDLPVDQIGREHVLRILTPIWTKRPEVARKLRGRIRTTLAWCQAHGYIEHNVAGEAIDAALPAMPAVAAHYRALPYREVGNALETVEASRASLCVKACVRFVALTACRSGEARGATWSEIDTEAREWRIPPSRMKAGVEHRVPLSDAALAVLELVRPLRGESDLIFPSQQGRELSNMTLTKALRAAGVDAVPHGFRSSFRDWASERTSVPHAVAEMALAHAVGSAVERSYARSDLFEKRRGLMDRWAAFVTGASAKVVRLHG